MTILQLDNATAYLKCPTCGHAAHRFHHFNGRGCEACGASIPLSEVQKKYPHSMGRYLTKDEREDIKSMVPPHGIDWSKFSPEISSEGWRLLAKYGPLLTEVLSDGEQRKKLKG